MYESVGNESKRRTGKLHICEDCADADCGFFHSIVFWRGGWFGIIEPAESFLPYSILAQWLQSFQVYAFALVSGYLFYYVKYERGGYKNFPEFAKKKAARLLVPYYFISAVWAVPVGICFFRYGVQDISRDYIFGNSLNQLWFLLMLFWALMFLFCMSDVIRKNAFVAIAAAVLFYGMSEKSGCIFRFQQDAHMSRF